MWTADPGDLAMSYSSSSEDDTYILEVTIEDGATNAVPGARVTLEVPDGTYYGPATTDDAGKVYFKGVPSFTDGSLTAWKHNYRPALDDGVDVP